LREGRWTELLARGLAVARKSPAQAATERKSAPWKLALAAWMKTRTQASNGWLTRQLHLGASAALSRNLTPAMLPAGQDL
jgi:hypothetical protein